MSVRLVVEMFFGLSIFGVYTHRQHSSQNVSLLRVSATSYRLEVSMIPLQGAFRKYRRGFFFSARGRRFDLAVLNIVWLRVYVLDSPMRDWFNKAAWQKARDPPPPSAFVNAPGVTDDFTWLMFFTVFFLGTCCTKNEHWSSRYSMRGFCLLYTFGKKSGRGCGANLHV